MVLHIREVLLRPEGVNIPVNLVSSTLESLKGMFFVEGAHSLITRQTFFLCHA